jgi:hypothetical protein
MNIIKQIGIGTLLSIAASAAIAETAQEAAVKNVFRRVWATR